jgi:hypothetical protein
VKDKQYEICNEHFKRIEESLSYIKESLDEHKERSLERQPIFNSLVTDVALIKDKQRTHLKFHDEERKEFQWKTGLIIGGVTFGITTLITLIINFWR